MMLLLGFDKMKELTIKIVATCLRLTWSEVCLLLFFNIDYAGAKILLSSRKPAV